MYTLLSSFLALWLLLWSLQAHAQSRLDSTDPAFKLPAPYQSEAFVDLLEPRPSLNFREDGAVSPESLAQIKKRSKQARAMKKRYKERSWQRLLEEQKEQSFLEQALLDQFGREGFSEEMGSHPYHESSGRRFTIVFFLTLPFSSFYTYLLFYFARSLSGQAVLSQGEGLQILGLGAGFAFWNAWQDYQNLQGDRSALRTDTWIHASQRSLEMRKEGISVSIKQSFHL